MYRIVVKCFKLLIAFIIAFAVANLVCFLYERPVGWINTQNGSGPAVREPGKILIHGTEGYSISKIDSHGYTNNDYPIADTYVLIMGSSHTQGKEVPMEDRYSSIINAEISNNAEELKAFNIACDGNFLPLIIKHFQSALTAYPDSTCIVIEIGSTDYSVDELEDAAGQIADIDTRSAQTLFSERSIKKKIIDIIKDYFPLLSRIKTQYATVQEATDLSDKDTIVAMDYYKALSDCLELIRSEYEGPIVFVYHPDVEINENGTMKTVYSETFFIFQRVCHETHIDLLDVGTEFCEHYNSTKELPYGFLNTTPGEGHLNKVGHSIIAESVIMYLREKNIQ